MIAFHLFFRAPFDTVLLSDFIELSNCGIAKTANASLRSFIMVP